MVSMGSEEKKMERKKISGKKPLKSWFFLLKIIVLILVSYLLVQLSNEAKRMEEKESIPSLQTTYDLAEKYMRDRYVNDWAKRGDRLYKRTSYLESYELFLRTDDKELKVLMYQSSENNKSNDRKREFSGFTFLAREDYFLISQEIEKNEDLYSIYIAYNGDPHIIVYYETVNADTYTQYDIPYEDGKYLRNTEMEEQTGITTEEAVEWAENIRKTFEEELWEMHDYQIDKARKIRGRLANLGLVMLAGIILIKWYGIRKRMRKEAGTMDRCIDESIKHMSGLIWEWRYGITAMGTAFWIYILRPVVSEAFLSGLNGMTKVCAAYGISAVITAVAACLLISKLKADNNKKGKVEVRISKLNAGLQMILGCIGMLAGIRLGIMAASDFYGDEWSFYVINLMAETVSLALSWLMLRLKYREKDL